MKTVIVGAGISGLSTYLFCKHHLSSVPGLVENVTIYESYDVDRLPRATVHGHSVAAAPAADALPSDAHATFTPKVIGGMLGISANGIKVIERIDGTGELVRKIWARGHAANKWQIENRFGWTMASVDAGAAPKTTASAGQKTAASAAGEKTTADDSLSTGLMISRQALWECLREQVEWAGGRIIANKRVVDVRFGQAHAPTVVCFADGTDEEADLVIGADGLRSVVRAAMFRDDKDHDYATPVYE